MSSIRGVSKSFACGAVFLRKSLSFCSNLVGLVMDLAIYLIQIKLNYNEEWGLVVDVSKMFKNRGRYKMRIMMNCVIKTIDDKNKNSSIKYDILKILERLAINQQI